MREREILRRLLGPRAREIGCDECFELLDAYVDLELAGRDADTAVPGLRAHLEGCPACAEDYESLRALAAAGDDA
jgi:anti-sigma factor RsiW